MGHRVRIFRQQHVLDEALRGHVPHAGRLGRFRQFRDSRLIDLTGEVGAEEERLADFDILGQQRLGVLIEVVDRRLPHLQRSLQPDVGGNVTGPPNPEPLRFRDHRVVRGA